MVDTVLRGAASHSALVAQISQRGRLELDGCGRSRGVAIIFPADALLPNLAAVDDRHSHPTHVLDPRGLVEVDLVACSDPGELDLLRPAVGTFTVFVSLIAARPSWSPAGHHSATRPTLPVFLIFGSMGVTERATLLPAGIPKHGDREPTSSGSRRGISTRRDEGAVLEELLDHVRGDAVVEQVAREARAGRVGPLLPVPGDLGAEAGLVTHAFGVFGRSGAGRAGPAATSDRAPGAPPRPRARCRRPARSPTCSS